MLGFGQSADGDGDPPAAASGGPRKTHDARYDLLREDAGIAAAIVATGSGDSLGPARDMRDASKTLDRLRSVVFPDWLPVYRDGNLYRVTALVNDKQPLTFSFGDTSQRTVILQSQADAAGLKVDDAAPRVKYRVAPGRDEMVQIVRIPRLRFGRLVLTNVEAGILPPEAAEAGARIGPGAFEGHRVHLTPSISCLTSPQARRM